MLYTFVTSYAGSLLVEQVEAVGIEQAVADWAHRSAARPRSHPGESFDYVPVKGTRDVWCVSGLNESDVFFWSHIILTA